MHTVHAPVMIVTPDAHLAAVLMRAFARESLAAVHWSALADATHAAVQVRPVALILDVGSAPDGPAAILRVHTLPTMRNVRITMLAAQMTMEEIHAALEAGADDIVVLGHTSPQDIVRRVKRSIRV